MFRPTVVKASAFALAEVPEANSTRLGDLIRPYKKVDICVAVVTPNGLITPFVKDVGSKGLVTISLEIQALAGEARDGKLKPEEYQLRLLRRIRVPLAVMALLHVMRPLGRCSVPDHPFCGAR